MQMSDWVVHKFGGSCLRIPGDLDRIIECLEDVSGRPAIIVSALWGVTDRLMRAIREPWQWSGLVNDLRRQHHRFAPGVEEDEAFMQCLNGLASDLLSLSRQPRDIDLQASILSSGERLSCITVASALARRGLETTHVQADDLGITIGDDDMTIDIEASVRALDTTLLAAGIPVISGWLGRTIDGRTRVLDRGGSDLTAAALASILDAQGLILWKDVPGILSVSPRWGIEATTIPYLGHEEALALARAGGIILHASCIEPLMGTGIPCWIRSLHSKESQTMIGPSLEHEDRGVIAISCVPGMIHYTINSPARRIPSVLESLLRILRDEAVKVWKLNAAEGRLSMFLPASLSRIIEDVLESHGCTWEHSLTATLISLIGRDIEVDMEGCIHHHREEHALHLLFVEEDLHGLMERLSTKFQLRNG